MRKSAVPWFVLSFSTLVLFLSASLLHAQTSYRSTYRMTVESPPQKAQRAGETSLWRFRVLDGAGEVRTEILRDVPFDVAAPSPAVFENGTVALIHSFDNVVEFFGPDGGLVRRASLSPVPAPEYERVIRHAVHDAAVALLVSEPGATECRLIVLDAGGNTVRERTLEGIQATGAVFAPDGRTIAAGVRTGTGLSDEATWFVNGLPGLSRGDEQVRRAEGGFSAGQFSADGATFLGRTNHSAFQANVERGEKVWDYRVPEGRLIVDAVLGSQGTTILTADAPTLEQGAWIYRRPVIRTMSSEGVVVNERAVPSAGFRKATLKSGSTTAEVVFDGVE